MSRTLDPSPAIPQEIKDAAASGELVVFVGAGVSRLINCPSWDDFANKVLQQLAPNGLDFYELSQIQRISDPKKRLSLAKIVAEKKNLTIDYSLVLDAKLPTDNIYTYLNSFNSSFVTTNYDLFLCPDSKKAEPPNNWRFYKREQLLGVHLDRQGNVMHLHGCMTNPSTMVITTKEYLDHYSSDEVMDFLTYLFRNKTVLFLGYGLEETEVLEYIFRQGQVSKGQGTTLRRYVLQPFFKAETSLYNLLLDYYRDSFETELIGFPKDHKSYDQLTSILADWSSKLRFGSLALSDEAAALEDEISG